MSDATLLLRARAILSQWHRLHLMSVKIGRLEPVADSGIAAAEIQGCRVLVEQADRLCADIDRQALGESVENGETVDRER